jgi:hypothetical protein
VVNCIPLNAALQRGPGRPAKAKEEARPAQEGRRANTTCFAKEKIMAAEKVRDVLGNVARRFRDLSGHFDRGADLHDEGLYSALRAFEVPALSEDQLVLGVQHEGWYDGRDPLEAVRSNAAVLKAVTQVLWEKAKHATSLEWQSLADAANMIEEALAKARPTAS